MTRTFACFASFIACFTGTIGSCDASVWKCFADLMCGAKRLSHLEAGNFPGDVGEHVNAALAFDVNGNPRERRHFAFHDFDAGEIHAVFGKRLLNDAAVFIVADQAEPAGASAEARDLREIIGGDAAGVNFHARGVDFFFRAEQAGNDCEIIHRAASDSDDVNISWSCMPSILTN